MFIDCYRNFLVSGLFGLYQPPQEYAEISINTRFGMNPAAESGVFLAKIHCKIIRKQVQ